MKIALCVAMETSKNTISTWIFFEDFFSMKHDIFLILKLWIKFLKELVVGQGLFSAKSPCLFVSYSLAFVFLGTPIWKPNISAYANGRYNNKPAFV